MAWVVRLLTLSVTVVGNSASRTLLQVLVNFLAIRADEELDLHTVEIFDFAVLLRVAEPEYITSERVN